MGPKQKEHIYQTFTAQSSIMIIVMFVMLGVFFTGITNPASWIYQMDLFADTSRSWYPILVFIPPIIGSIAQLFLKRQSLHVQDFVVITMSFLTIPMILVLYPYVLNGSVGISFPELLG